MDLEAKTIRWRSNSGGGHDFRHIQVEVGDVCGRTLRLMVVWLGDDGNRARYGRFKTQKKTVKADGIYNFQVTCPNLIRRKFDRNYRGFAVRVGNAKGLSLGETASMPGLARFLPQQ